MHRFDQKMNYNYITQFKFCLSLYPILILIALPLITNVFGSIAFTLSLLRTIVPSRPVLVELLPRREGAERPDILPKLG